jgi:hypothetical protein
VKRLLGLLLAAVLVPAGATAAQAHRVAGSSGPNRLASCPGAVRWQDARKMIGRDATIKGPVAGTYYASASSGSPTFLNLGVDYPSKRRVTVVIWIENRGRFGRPESRYRGHYICVRGHVKSYDGVPDIEATSPSQILVVG